MYSNNLLISPPHILSLSPLSLSPSLSLSLSIYIYIYISVGCILQKQGYALLYEIILHKIFKK